MIIIPAILDTFSSLKDKTLKLVFHSNELTPEQLLGVVKNVQQFGFLAFKKESFKGPEIDVIKNLDTEYQRKGKSNSQRLRSVLYVYYTQKDCSKKGSVIYLDFNEFYDNEMNRIIEHYKNKLD